MNIIRIKTIVVGIGEVFTTDSGPRSVDFLYQGTTDGVTITGQVSESDPIPIPPSVPFTLEYSDNYYDGVIVTNNGNAPVYIVEKF